MTIAKATNRTAPQFITALKDFKGSSIKGSTHKGADRIQTGQMPKEFAEELELHQDFIGPLGSIFVVYSYETPIAWHTEAFGWRRPDKRYSVTTSKHQGMCPRV